MARPTPRIRVVQGADLDRTWQTPNPDGSVGNVFVAGDPITAVVWMGDQEAVLATPAVVWGSQAVAAALGAPQTIWTIQLHASDTATIAPGRYRLQVFGTHSGRKGTLFDGLLDVADTAGTTVATDLITLTYAESACSRLRLIASERDFLPSLVAAASDTVRKWCGQRDFTRQTYVEEHQVELNGYVALRQYPVNNVTRIRGYPQTVLTISADPGVNQQAWIDYTTAGDWASGTLAYTGITLNWIQSGTAGSAPFLFTTYPTVGALQAAIAATAGWSAQTTAPFSLYPTSDLSPPGGLTSQGAIDDTGAEIRAYTEDLTLSRLDNRTGMLWCGRRRSGSAYGQRWGEDWEVLDESGGAPIGRIQVSYDAGFATVPAPVQLATAELVKALVERFRRDHGLSTESVSGAGSHAYSVAAELMGMLPVPVRQSLSLYRRISARP
jgi:hypothetical protein